jgi:hypothetical protein
MLGALTIIVIISIYIIHYVVPPHYGYIIIGTWYMVHHYENNKGTPYDI